MVNKKVMKHEVGYGKPPRASRFQRGRSGNPKGRPKGAKNFETLVEEELEAKVPVVENGKRKRITKRRAAVKQVVNKAAGGDLKALTLLTKTGIKAGGSDVENGESGLDTEHDQKVIAALIERLRRTWGATAATAAEDGGIEAENEERDSDQS